MERVLELEQQVKEKERKILDREDQILAIETKVLAKVDALLAESRRSTFQEMVHVSVQAPLANQGNHGNTAAMTTSMHQDHETKP
jgi:hypothetical protein